MRDIGNTLIVVEHDEDTMRAADYIVDIGPKAGVHGGEVVACGTLDDIIKSNPVPLQVIIFLDVKKLKYRKCVQSPTADG